MWAYWCNQLVGNVDLNMVPENRYLFSATDYYESKT